MIRDSPVFYPPPETMDSEEDSGDDEGDMAPSSGGRSSAEVFSITYPKTVTNWSPRTNKTLKCYQSNAFQSAVRETLRVWTFAHVETRRRGRKRGRRRNKSNERTTNGGIDVFVAASFRECYCSYHNLERYSKRRVGERNHSSFRARTAVL